MSLCNEGGVWLFKLALPFRAAALCVGGPGLCACSNPSSASTSTPAASDFGRTLNVLVPVFGREGGRGGCARAGGGGGRFPLDEAAATDAPCGMADKASDSTG
jgi:hypothetical protein